MLFPSRITVQFGDRRINSSWLCILRPSVLQTCLVWWFIQKEKVQQLTKDELLLKVKSAYCDSVNGICHRGSILSTQGWLLKHRNTHTNAQRGLVPPRMLCREKLDATVNVDSSQGRCRYLEKLLIKLKFICIPMDIIYEDSGSIKLINPCPKSHFALSCYCSSTRLLTSYPESEKKKFQ